MVDACYFFNSLSEPLQKWPNLKFLALTSLLLSPDESHASITDMLQEAAAAAIRMPQLETLEIWNGREKLAAFFRYEFRPDELSTITRGSHGISFCTLQLSRLGKLLQSDVQARDWTWRMKASIVTILHLTLMLFSCLGFKSW
jgi:hypothetical protein